MAKNKKATIKLKNVDHKRFPYAIMVAVNHKNIVKDPQKYQKLSLLLINIIGKK